MWVWMRYVEEYCAGPVLEALEGFQKVWGSLCGVKSLLEGFSVSGSCLEEGWVGAGEEVLLGFWVFPAASACGGVPEVAPMHVVPYGQGLCVKF